ncbi:MAG: ATP-binding protein [Candidatus Ozemobacteraceae bacterium]
MTRDIETLVQTAGPGSVLVDLHMYGDLRCLSLIRRIIVASAAAVKISFQVLSDIKLAVTEACTNVIRHAYKYDHARKFVIQLQVSEHVYQIRISYEDPGFDPATIPVPNLMCIKEGGFGVFIIRKIMDDVLYVTDKMSGGVELRMVKRLDSVISGSGSGG